MGTILTTPNTKAAILAKLAELSRSELTPAEAEYVLAIRLSAADTDSINRLSGLAQAGALTPDQRAELESFVEMDDLLANIQSQARRVLKGFPGSE